MTDDMETPARGGVEAGMVSVLDRSLGYMLAALVFAMMILTFVDVVGRQAFNSPVPAGFEITEILMGFTVYLGLPLVCARREHITIGLLDQLFGETARRVQAVVLNILLAGLTLLWARELWIHAGVLARQNELLMFLQIQVSTFVYGMFVLTVFAAAIFLVLAWTGLRGAAPASHSGSG